ncbi:hypothetical protein [uncultured Sphingomonas sp.]|uniref:hypothetical protein n=1 Tax=uncultured Sphingomonas sp. TaxID=158754 RepID=UPI0030F738D7
MIAAFHHPAGQTVTIVRSDGVRLEIAEAEALALAAALATLRPRPAYRNARSRRDREAVFTLVAQ